MENSRYLKSTWIELFQATFYCNRRKKLIKIKQLIPTIHNDECRMFKIFVTKTDLVDLFFIRAFIKSFEKNQELEMMIKLIQISYDLDIDEFYIQDGNRRILSLAFLISVIRQLAFTNVSIVTKCDLVFSSAGDSNKKLQFIDASLPDYCPLRYGQFSKIFSTAILDGNFDSLYNFSMKENAVNKKDAQEILKLKDKTDIIKQELCSKDEQFLSLLVDHTINKCKFVVNIEKRYMNTQNKELLNLCEAYLVHRNCGKN